MLRRWSSGRSAGLRQAQVNGLCPDSGGHAGDGRLRLLSFNIQVGISTERYRHYLTRGWQHLLPHHGRAGNLQRIGALLGDYDLVALQEVDGGSLRSGYINQVERLAELGAFPYWYQQLNRDLGRLAQHSNGVLSRLRPDLVEDHPLPGPPGRGAILVRFGEGADAFRHGMKADAQAPAVLRIEEPVFDHVGHSADQSEGVRMVLAFVAGYVEYPEQATVRR